MTNTIVRRLWYKWQWCYSLEMQFLDLLRWRLAVLVRRMHRSHHEDNGFVSGLNLKLRLSTSASIFGIVLPHRWQISITARVLP